jgi:hypothetical protein
MRDSRTGSSTDSRISLRFSIGSCMSSRVTPELGLRRIPEPAVLRGSHHRQLEVPGFRMFVTPFLHRIKIPELRPFANSRLHRFQASENREFPAPEKHVSRTLSNLTFRGWRVFLNSPTVPFIDLQKSVSCEQVLCVLHQINFRRRKSSCCTDFEREYRSAVRHCLSENQLHEFC